VTPLAPTIPEAETLPVPRVRITMENWEPQCLCPDGGWVSDVPRPRTSLRRPGAYASGADAMARDPYMLPAGGLRHRFQKDLSLLM